MSLIEYHKPPVVITAVGRSGTTITERLLARILTQHEGKPRSIYEPFLWDHRELLKRADDIKRFTSFETVSSEGIFYHTHFPLFMDEEYLNSDSNQIYLDGFERYLFENRDEEGEQREYPRHLIKFIRANGRLPLLTKMMPNGRFILMLRNPLDTLNSIINIFSFHGDEFYKSDYPRFQKSVKDYFNETIPDHKDVPIALKQTYWIYYQTMIALDYALNDERFLIVPYEEFMKHPKNWVQKMCSHIQVPFHDEYLDELNNEYGVINRHQININKEQVQRIMPLFKRYISNVEKRLNFKHDTAKIIEKYTNNPENLKDVSFVQQYKPRLGHHAHFYFHKFFNESVLKRSRWKW